MGIAENIRRLRKEYGYTQEQLAEKVGVTRATVAQWEIGWSQPRMGAVTRLAEIFAVPLSGIVDDARQTDSSSTFAKELSAYLTPRELALLDTFRALDERGKITVESVARSQRGSSQDTGIQTTQAS